jgi:hypothetical protein
LGFQNNIYMLVALRFAIIDRSLSVDPGPIYDGFCNLLSFLASFSTEFPLAFMAVGLGRGGGASVTSFLMLMVGLVFVVDFITSGARGNIVLAEVILGFTMLVGRTVAPAEWR